MDNKEAYFDFQEKTELPEKHDFANLKQCPHCHKPIPQDSTMCLYCGETVYFSENKPNWIKWVAILVIIAFLALILF